MLFPLGLALLRHLLSTIRDVSGCNKGNYFLCIVLLYVRIHNDLWMTYDDSKDLRLNKCSKILLLFECTFFDDLLVRRELDEVAVVGVGVCGRLAGAGWFIV